MRSSVRHRIHQFRGKLKGTSDTALLSYLAVTVVSPRMGEKGWSFASVDKFPAADVDPLYGSDYARDLYLRADPSYDGRFVCFAAFWRPETGFVTIPPIGSPSLCFGTRRTKRS